MNSIQTALLVIMTAFCTDKPQPATGKPAAQAIVVRKISSMQQDGKTERDTSMILYTQNAAGDSLNVYTVRKGMVADATGYALRVSGNSATLQVKPVYSQESIASLKLSFNDAAQTVRINNRDEYTLYPDYYKQVKTQLRNNGALMTVFSLLQDNIGDYPLEPVFPLLATSSQVQDKKCIRTARVVTPRSQANAIQDTWNCAYTYDKGGKLASVLAASGNAVRFRKQVTYTGGTVSLKTYRNIEDRQVTERTITRKPGATAPVSWEDRIEETGKNRETEVSALLYKMPSQPTAALKMPQADVLKLISNADHGSRK